MTAKILLKRQGKECAVTITPAELREAYKFILRSLPLKSHPLGPRVDLLASLVKKLGHVVHDILDEGVTYSFVNGTFYPNKDRHYFFKKPQWK